MTANPSSWGGTKCRSAKKIEEVAQIQKAGSQKSGQKRLKSICWMTWSSKIIVFLHFYKNIMHCADENDWKLSNCCWARIRLDLCTDCKEHCTPQEEEDEVEEPVIRLKNEFVEVRIDKDWVYAKDLTDKENEESVFTQSKRNVKKAGDEIRRWFCPTFTFQTVIQHLTGYKIKYHRYCAMD